MPDASGASRTARRCPSSVIDVAPNPGSSPVTEVGSIESTSSFGSWSLSSTGSVTRLSARTPNASGSAMGGFGSIMIVSCSSLGSASGFVRSSSDQS